MIHADQLLGLSEFEILDFDDSGKDDVIFIVKPKEEKLACPVCGCTMTIKNGSYVRRVVDLPFQGKRSILEIHTHQYICTDANGTCTKKYFTPSFGSVDDGRQLSNRLIAAISEDVLKKNTFLSLAEKYHVDEKVIRIIFEDTIREKSKTYAPQAPQHLGIDEAHLDSSMCLVLTDTGSTPARIIELIEDRKIPYVIAALNSLANQENIETVSMDMWEGYRTAVQECLPHARIIVDRFHIMSHCLDAVEKVRSALCAGISDRISSLPVGEREIAKKEYDDLEINHYWFKANLETLSPGSKRKFATALRRYPELATLYRIRESFYVLCEESEDVADAKARYQAWTELIPRDAVYNPIRAFCKTISRWEAEFFNYFVEPKGHRFSNGKVEAVIGSIKNTSRAGYGYKFETLRGKLLFGESSISRQTGGKRPPTHYPRRKKSYYIDSCDSYRLPSALNPRRKSVRKRFGRKRK